ncbi:MAG: hypothetical protein WCR51_06790 [Planctomycetia bacterium]
MPPTPFDPCKQWLGIDAVDLVDPRRVLGISPRETDAAKVVHAAQRRLDRLHGVNAGPFAVARNALVKRVEEARDALLAEIATPPRAAHSSGDRLSMPPPPGGAASPGPRATVPAVPRVPPVPTVPRPAASSTPWPDAGGDDHAHAPAIEIRRPVVYRKKSSGSGVLLLLIAGLAAAAGGLYWFKFRPNRIAARPATRDVAVGDTPSKEANPKPKINLRKDRREEPSDEPTHAVPAIAPAPQPPAPMPKPRVKAPPPEEPPAIPAVPETPAKSPEPSPPPEPPAEDTAAIEASLRKVPEFLRASDFAAATQAATQAAASSQTKASRDRAERWAELVTFAKGFADYRNQALATVTPGVEFDIEGKKIIVVEIDDEKFVYRFAGKNRTTPRGRIPGGILMAIVTTWFDDNPANDLFIGAYHATKEEPDLDKARASWEKANAGGADASLLLPLLDDPLLTASE